jgi:hypothetical protein
MRWAYEVHSEQAEWAVPSWPRPNHVCNLKKKQQQITQRNENCIYVLECHTSIDRQVEASLL